jgi:hypothetical protein
MNNDLAQVTPDQVEALKQQSKIVAASGLVPDHFQKNPASIYVCIQIAKSIGEDPVQLMQASYFIDGKIGLSSQYLLARLRRSGAIRGTVQYIEEGDRENLSVRAQATDRETGEKVLGPAASMAMARDDGWVKNTKYTTMPEIMLRNRALSFLVRYHYPDATAGLPMADELQDIAAASKPQPMKSGGALAEIEATLSEGEDDDR